jgi:hypothetical protein
MSFEECEIPFFANKIVRIKIIEEDFAAFFFLVKLSNRVFQQAGRFVKTR